MKSFRFTMEFKFRTLLLLNYLKINNYYFIKIGPLRNKHLTSKQKIRILSTKAEVSLYEGCSEIIETVLVSL